MDSGLVVLIVFIALVGVIFLIIFSLLLFSSIRTNESVQVKREERIGGLPPPIREQIRMDRRRGQTGHIGMLAVILGIPLLISRLRPGDLAWGGVSNPTLGWLLTLAVFSPFALAYLGAAILGRLQRGSTVLDLGQDELVAAANRHWFVPVFISLILGKEGVELAADGHVAWASLFFLWIGVLLGAQALRSSRIVLTDRGLFSTGMLYPWTRVEQCHWADDGRCFALKVRRPWPLDRWVVVPVPGDRHAAAGEALEQLLPAGVVTTLKPKPVDPIDLLE